MIYLENLAFFRMNKRGSARQENEHTALWSASLIIRHPRGVKKEEIGDIYVRPGT